jgi:hypothetical protein
MPDSWSVPIATSAITNLSRITTELIAFFKMLHSRGSLTALKQGNDSASDNGVVHPAPVADAVFIVNH